MRFDPNCKACRGEGTYYEDVAGDGGGQMPVVCDCLHHDPRSEALMRSLQDVAADREECPDFLETGGDGDAGEDLLDLLDEHFKREDLETAAKTLELMTRLRACPVG